MESPAAPTLSEEITASDQGPAPKACSTCARRRSDRHADSRSRARRRWPPDASTRAASLKASARSAYSRPYCETTTSKLPSANGNDSAAVLPMNRAWRQINPVLRQEARRIDIGKVDTGQRQLAPGRGNGRCQRNGICGGCRRYRIRTRVGTEHLAGKVRDRGTAQALRARHRPDRDARRARYLGRSRDLSPCIHRRCENRCRRTADRHRSGCLGQGRPGRTAAA